MADSPHEISLSVSYLFLVSSELWKEREQQTLYKVANTLLSVRVSAFSVLRFVVVVTVVCLCVCYSWCVYGYV